MEKILACEPVSWEQLNEEQKTSMVKKGNVEGVPTYVGSSITKCGKCFCEVFIGPRQRSMRLTGHRVLCYTCVYEYGQSPTVVHLGNKDEVCNLN